MYQNGPTLWSSPMPLNRNATGCCVSLSARAGVLPAVDAGKGGTPGDPAAPSDSDDEPPPAQLERPCHGMESSFLIEIDPATFAPVNLVSDPRIAGKWLGVLERVDFIVATGATTVVLPCAMLRGEGLGVQVRFDAVRLPHRHAAGGAFGASRHGNLPLGLPPA